MNSLLRVIEKAVALGRFPLPENPILPWPRFSLASYTLTARLAAEGVNPRTIVDVGANRGQFTVSCMKRFEHPRIYAFEPVPVAFRSLLAATKRFKEVTAYNLAIGERNGQVTFHVASDVQSSSILRQNESFGAAFADAAVTRTIELEMQTLDTALRNVAIDSPVLLKLDVQGYETRVIDGARSFLGAVDVIVAETSFAPLYEGEGAFLALVDLLDDCGFDFVRPVGTLVSPTSGAFLQMDALFLRKRVATVGPEIAMRRRVNGLVAG